MFGFFGTGRVTSLATTSSAPSALRRHALLAWLLFVGAGCQATPAVPIALPPMALPAAAPAPAEVPRAQLGPCIPIEASASDAVRLVAAQGTSADVPDAAPGIGLNEAIETGLARNPDLIALRATEGVGAAMLGVARTYPFNPTLQTRVLPYGRDPDGTSTSAYNYVLFWQTFELAHQQRHRTANATAALENVRWTIQQANLQNVALTAQLYFTAQYQRGLRELARQTAQLNDELLAITEKRVRAGGASAADAALVRIDARAARQQARLADVTDANALLALRRQLNLPPDATLKLAGELADFAWHPATGAELCQLIGHDTAFTTADNSDALAARLASGRPDVLAARANLDAAGANLGLARAARVPNVMIGPFYLRDAHATLSAGFQAQMDVPIVNNGTPLVHQRQAELSQRQAALTQLEAKARVEALTALQRYERARTMCMEMRGEASRPLPEELRKLEEQFRRGEIDFLRIVQARNSLIQYRRTYLDSLNELAQAAAAVTAAAGLPPAALVDRPRR